MNYKIEQKKAFRVVGVKEHGSVSIEENFTRIPMFWGETFQNGMFEVICGIAEGEPKGVLGISTCMDGSEFDYYIACASQKQAPEGTYEYVVPAATWAIFPCIGPMPSSVQELQKRIVSEWLPTSGYEYTDAPDIEVYPEGDTSSPQYQCEVWVPVNKK